jgi:hypothetical protein
LYRHKYYLIHNGIIYNAEELKSKHEQLGITYVTSQLSQHMNYWGKVENSYEFNDSEALAHEVALVLEGKQDKIEAEGEVAFVCLETDRNNNALKLHFARNRGMPLEMRRDSSCLTIASENVSHQDIPPNKLYTFDYRTREIAQRGIELPEYEYFSHFSSHPIDFYWDKLEELELKIPKYEDKLQSIEHAQLEASIKGDAHRYERLGLIKESIEEQLEHLYNELYWLEREYFG